MDPYELQMQRRNTLAYIASDPKVVDLLRTTRERDDSGGWREVVDTPVGEQVMRLVTTHANQATRNVDGEQVTADAMLIARWDADIARGDKFTDGGETYTVIFVHPDPLYQKTAEVVLGG